MHFVTFIWYNVTKALESEVINMTNKPKKLGRTSKENYREIITKRNNYTKCIGVYDNGKVDFKNITLNTPENAFLNIKSLGIEECTNKKESRLHTFECTTLHFVISGKGYFDSMELYENDCFLIKKNQSAEYYPDKDNPWHYCWINFDGKSVDTLLMQIGITEDKCTFSYKDCKNIYSIIEAAIEENFDNKSVALYMNSVLLRIFSYLSGGVYDTFFESSQSVAEKRVSDAIEYINTHYSEKGCINSLAQKQGVTKRYLSRIFAKYSNITPREHLIRARIEQSKSLLRGTKMPITEIGNSVGYEDVMQFSKIFKKYTGISPTAYRGGKRDKIRQFE